MSNRLYDTHKWRKERKKFLNENPLCKYCKECGIIKPATVVDHIEPHHGNEKLFWDKNNWQALCKSCHDSAKAIKESRGNLPGCRIDGIPLDEEHPWNK